MTAVDINNYLKFQVITDEGNTPNRTHLEVAMAGCEGRATLIQYRDKQSSSLKMYKVAREIRKITTKKGIYFVVNDRLDIAMAVDADGVHLGQTDLPIPVARHIWGKDKIYGASASNMKELNKAIAEGADYIGFGPIYGGRIVYEVKPDAAPPSGLEVLREAVSLSRIPIIGIGGITEDNITEVLETGVKGIAVVAAVAWAEDMVKATTKLRSIIDLYLP
ncbi:MAG: Thiamine-phosphate synthase [candidate division WS2 bacterium]|nr:Thiamine-phosphate synthase [Candidatus Lithacetigena glycinireducens]MBT9175571.1 Thiamine-phosphate synthase [Candidatus Lithacetigena glycinireducens]